MKAKFVSNILKPKSKEDIEKDFVNLPVSKQVELLNDLSYEEQENYISEESWPLIQRIKERLKENVNFDMLFRCTSTITFYFGLSTYNIYSRKFNKLGDASVIKIDQYDDDPSFINIVFREKTHRVTSYEGVIIFFGRYYVDASGNTVSIPK